MNWFWKLSSEIQYEFAYNDYGGLIEEYEIAARKIANNSGLNILRDKDLLLVALKDSEVIAGLWTSFDISENIFSFDIAVKPEFRKKGVGQKLLEYANNEFSFFKDMSEDSKIQVDVVNPIMKNMLEKNGFRILEDTGQRWLMEKVE